MGVFGSKGINPWIGWGISTLLLLWLNRKSSSDSDSDTSSQQPSKFTEDTGNQIGNCIPVVIGRAMLKNPLISYYGDYSWRVYTEEYGLHSDLDLKSWWWPILLALIAAISTKDTIKVEAGTGVEDQTGAIASKAVPGGSSVTDEALMPAPNTLTVLPEQEVMVNTSEGPAFGKTTSPGLVEGTISYSGTGTKRAAIVNVLAFIIAWILQKLFGDHEGRVTIQKGFKYYLGWQNILCWTGDNFGLKRIWMNVYDTEVEQSTEQGVWGSDKIVWKKDNPRGIIAYVEDEDMFGGVDEGGGFIGHIHVYFGTTVQPFDAWMQEQMAQSANIPSSLKGLTPRYPMFVTCVVNNAGVYSGSGGSEVAGGAYIGKQATVPEMWFEVVNYPSTLQDNYKDDLKRLFKSKIDKLNDLVTSVANTEGIPAGARNEYNSYKQSINSLDVDNLSDAKSKTSALLNSLSDDLDLYRRVKKVDDLLNHGVWKLGRIDDDSNPAEVLCEILINSYWGCHYDLSTDVIDIDSLLMLGATCEEEGLGISCLITNTAQAYEYVDKILTHINGVKFDDPSTGKLTFKLIRPDYDISKLKVFTPSNCESLEFTRLDWSETSSSVSVNFTLADNKYVDAQLLVSDMANPLITGVYSEFNVDGTYFTTPKNARIMAQTQLLSAGYPLSAVNFVCNRYGYDLCIGDPIVVNWDFYGISKQIFRVTDIDYGTLLDGKITITALEDVFGFDQTDYAFVPTPVWTDPEEDPQDIEHYLFLELPYEMSSELHTYVYAYAAQPSLETVQWYVWRYMGVDYANRNTSTEWSMMGRMVYGLDEKYDKDDMIGFEISYVPNNSEHDLDEKIKAINNNPYLYTNTSGLNLLECNGEIMSYSNIEKLANGHYRVYGLIRGIYDTLPKVHVAYDVVHFLEKGLNVNLDKPVVMSGISHESLELTTSSQTKVQPFDQTATIDFTTVNRAESPSVMANLKLGADRGNYTVMDYSVPASTIFSHDIKFTYKARNKFNNSSIKGQTDNSIAVNNFIKNYIKWKVGSDEYEVKLDAYDSTIPATLEDMTLKWATVCANMGNKVRAINEMSLEIGTYNSDSKLYSYDHYEKQIQVTPPTLIGIVGSEADIKPFLTSTLDINNMTIRVPAQAQTTTEFVLSYERAPLIFIGTPNPVGEFMHWDGTRYDLTTTAYRIDGAIEDINNPGTYIPSWHKITIDENYIFLTHYTGFYSTIKYYRLWFGEYLEYNIYVEPIQ